MPSTTPLLDCLIVGGGPAGLTAALYLARFERTAIVIDGGDPRARWIPKSHNIPLFAEGISGPDILARQRAHAFRYGASIERGTVRRLRLGEAGFVAEIDERPGRQRYVRAKKVLLATGADDVEPELPGLADAIRRGLVRYCPICDGYEVRDKSIAVIGYGDRGFAEATFIARTYSARVTLLTLGKNATRASDSPLRLDAERKRKAEELGISIVADPIAALEIEGDRIAALRTGDGREMTFDTLYSALGLKPRSVLARDVGAVLDDTGAVVIDDHNRTTVAGLYAAGGVACGLDQVVVAMGHAAIAATDIHNRCDLPMVAESQGK